MEKKEWSEAELRSKAARYCAAAEHCESEVREKLRQWGAETDAAQRIVKYLIGEKYIDENRYAHAFTMDKLRYQGWGRVKIRAMLAAKRISAAAIQDALCAIDEEEYQRILKKVAGKKKGASEIQLARFLLQRGFTPEEVRASL